jgi:hypothetical protein
MTNKTITMGMITFLIMSVFCLSYFTFALLFPIYYHTEALEQRYPKFRFIKEERQRKTVFYNEGSINLYGTLMALGR